MDKALRIEANSRAYHPICEYLEQLEWDGQERIRYVLQRYMGADASDFVYEVVKHFLMEALSRIYRPGCKADEMLCLVGQQGAGKSTFFRFLALNDDWFSDDLKQLNDSKIYEHLRGHWIMEMSEMIAAISAKSNEEIKSFLTRQKDTYRNPYDKYEEDRKRQCIFAGSTNTRQFIPFDRTGARRFLPIAIDSSKAENAENMAHAYRIPIPDIKKQLIAFAVIPILIVVGTYIPQYIKGKQAMDQRIAASAKQVEIVKKALEPVCVRVHADNPNESRSRSSYTVMGYLRDSGATDCYVHVQVNNSGTIINISYVEGVDINKSLEENLMQTEKDFATLQKSFENLNVSVSNPEILSYQAIPQQFKDEFLNGTFYKSFRFYDQDAPISLSCSFDTETEDQFDEYTRPKIHFFLGSK